MYTINIFYVMKIRLAGSKVPSLECSRELQGDPVLLELSGTLQSTPEGDLAPGQLDFHDIYCNRQK